MHCLVYSQHEKRGGDGEQSRRWRLRGSVGAEACQCPLKLFQFGLDDAERDRAAMVDVAVEGTQASRANILDLPTSIWESEEDDRKVAGACSEALRRLKTTSTAGEGGPVSQRPPQDGLQSLSDGTVNIRTGLADVGGRTGENDIGKLGEGGYKPPDESRPSRATTPKTP